MFTLAHISDPHLAGWSVANPLSLISKRLSGFLSWRLNRAKIHRTEILDLIVASLLAAKPDHIAVTGDLTNIALPQEFTGAAAWLQRLGPSDEVSVIPGNHDAYVPMPWAETIGLWQANMSGLMPGDGPVLGATEQPVTGADDFPYVRQRGPIALIGTSTAVPMPLFIAAGELGSGQLARLATILERLGQAGLFRVLLIHHPPFPDRHGSRKALRDHAELRHILREKGVELVLHGHTHVAGLSRIATPTGEAPVIGVPSASAQTGRHKDAAAYHLYRIEHLGDAWQIRVDVNSLSEDGHKVVPAGEMLLTIP